jgi:hypothetical protein
MESYKEKKTCIVEWEIAFFKSSPVDEYHPPQMNSEKVFFMCTEPKLAQTHTPTKLCSPQNFSSLDAIPAKK